MHRTFIALATAAGVLIASSANAETYEARIAYGDLDLASEAGADALLDRVDAAAREVCEHSSARISLQESRAVRECVRDFTARAVAQLDHPKVGARFAERIGARAVVLASVR
jgi:UrcA family protein